MGLPILHLTFIDARVADGFSDDDLNMMPVPEYIDFIQTWVNASAT